MSALSELNLADAGLSSVTCCECGLVFYTSSRWVDERRADHKGFKCPNGHSLVFRGKSREEELQEKLDREKRRHEFTRNARDAQSRRAETNERRRRAEKAAKTRLRRRVAAGRCPCCSESFPNLAEHMATRHPEEPA